MKKFAVLLAMVLMAAPTLSQAATAAANTINSAAIIKADGTSGQTLTTGNGVKTGHIQDAAVTAAKLAAGSVSSSKIFGQLSTSKLRVGTTAGTVAAGNHTHVVNTADLAAGAVTDAKISGVISTSKLNVGTVSGTVAAGDHSHVINTSALADGAVTDAKIASMSASKLIGSLTADKLASYAGVKVVHTGAVDNVNSFNTLSAALQAIGPNTATRWAVYLMPGTYAEDFSFLDSIGPMNVDIIGANKAGSVIRTIGNHWRPNEPNWKPYIHMADGLFLKNLSVIGIVDVNYSTAVGVVDCNLYPAQADGGIWGYAVMGHAPKSLTLQNLYIETDQMAMWLYAMGDGHDEEKYVFNNIYINGITPGCGGIWAFESNTSKPLRFSNVTVAGQAAWGFAFYSYSGGEIEVMNSTFASPGVAFTYGGSGWHNVHALNCNFGGGVVGDGSSLMNVTVDNSSIKGPIAGTASPVKIGGSKIIGPVNAGNGLVKIINSWDGNYDAIPNGSY